MFLRIGVWCSWLACLHGVQVVARSSRATPTFQEKSLTSGSFFYDYFFVELMENFPKQLFF